MEITIHSTSKVVTLNNDVPARIWEGETKSGIKVYCFVTRVAVPEEADQTEFQKELQEHAAPSPEMEAIPLRLIL